MLALDYWKAVTTDQSRFLDRIVTLLSESGFRKCIIGGQAVNAYVEPVVSLDLAVAVAASDLAPAEALFRREYKVERFAHSIQRHCGTVRTPIATPDRKRQTDLADISRLLEAYPELRRRVPDDVLARLI